MLTQNLAAGADRAPALRGGRQGSIAAYSLSVCHAPIGHRVSACTAGPCLMSSLSPAACHPLSSSRKLTVGRAQAFTGSGIQGDSLSTTSNTFSDGSAAGARGSGPGSAAASSSNGKAAGHSLPAVMAASPALTRKVLTAQSALEAADLLMADLQAQAPKGSASFPSEAECTALMLAALERGNTALATSIHEAMCAARRAVLPGAAASSMSSMDGTSPSWPPASIATTTAYVLGLCRQLCVREATATIAGIRSQGLASDEAVGFGKVVSSPLAPTQTLTVVQPQEGCKVVADAFSRYLYEVFSGRVLTCKSEALQVSNGLLGTVLRAVGILRKPPVAAVHELVVQAPDGVSRTFRVATSTADVPAQVGERVTFVCAPSTSALKSSRKPGTGGLLPPTPPDTQPGEALTATNHKTGVVTQLQRPPLAGANTTIPGWVLPAAVILAGGDAASSLLDPALPLIIAGSVAAVGGSAVAGNQLLLPRLKQLPEKAVSVEYVRQRLLGQYAQLASKVETVLSESSEDVRVLARLWQLQNKMQSVSSAAAAPPPSSSTAGTTALAAGGSTYGARMERVAAARANIEERLSKKLLLLDGYARVMNMIEIEVELEIEVPTAELAGIEQQMERLNELEGLQDDWRVQAEARDEVERLLRTL